MSLTTAPLFELVPIQMDVSFAIIRDALAPLELRNLIAKIITLTIYPFLMISTFEAIVINGTKVLLNCVIVAANYSHSYLFSPKIERAVEISPVPKASATVAPEAAPRLNSQNIINMPPPTQEARQKIEFIVTTLSAGLGAAFSNRQKLEAIKEQIVHLHPFQFLDAIFGQFSKVKPLMPSLKNGNWFIYSQFLGGLTESMAKPEHQKNTRAYLPSFAKKMKVPLETIRPLIFPKQNWAGLVKLLIETHSGPSTPPTTV